MAPCGRNPPFSSPDSEKRKAFTLPMLKAYAPMFCPAGSSFPGIPDPPAAAMINRSTGVPLQQRIGPLDPLFPDPFLHQLQQLVMVLSRDLGQFLLRQEDMLHPVLL